MNTDDCLSPSETARALLTRHLSSGPKGDCESYLSAQMRCSNVLALSLVNGLEKIGCITGPDKDGHRSVRGG